MKPKLITGSHYLHAHMDNFLFHALGNTFWKDKNGKYLGANKNELDLFGLSSFDDLTGRDDRELMYLAHAELCRENDQKVIHDEKGMVFVELGPKEKDKQRYISYKAPLYNAKGKIIGTFGIGYELGLLPQKDILREIALFADAEAQAIFRQTLLNFHQTQLGLSPRQMECLDLLAKGMTYKQIGATLGLSPRTVEHYFEAIKIRLNCECRHSLITKYLS